MAGAGRIGLFEARRQTAGFDRRSLLTLVLGAIAIGLVLWWALGQGVQPDEGIYRVEGTTDHPLWQAASADPRFVLFEGDGSRFAQGGAELWLHDDVVDIRPDEQKSRAAVQALAQAAKAWNEDRLVAEDDLDAAFPVTVHVVHDVRANAAAQADAAEAGDGSDGGAAAQEPVVVSQPSTSAQVQRSLRPADVDPPFPMRSILLTFAYMVPMNLLGQTYSGALLSERVRGRGVMLLSGPVSGASVLWGKSLPFALLTLLLAGVVTWWIGATWVGLLAALAFLGFLLGASALLGLTARNLRELTFLQVALTTSTSLFLFLPAIFTSLPPVAFLSPVHVIASGIRGESVAVVPFLYATLPIALAGAALALLATALYREETLFAPRSPWRLTLDGIAEATRRPWADLGAGALAVPFAYAAEILLVVFAVTLDLRIAFLLFLFGGAAVEEVLKALPAWSRMGRPGTRPPWVTGLMVGTGFFIAEKLALLLGLAGFADLPFGEAALAAFGAGTLALLLAPLLLHTATATVSAWGAAHGRGWAVVAILAAIAVHASYNAIVILGAI